MRQLRSVIFMAIAALPLSAQTPTSLTPAAVALVNSANAQFGQTAPNGLHVSGSATQYLGGTQESGSFSADLRSDGSSTFQLSLPSGTRTDAVSALTADPDCSWTDNSGKQHLYTPENCWANLSWIAPTFSFGRLPSNYAFSSEANGVKANRNVPLPSGSADIQAYKLSEAHVLLNSTTGLPTTYTYNAHPDKDPSANVPIRIEYSQYQAVAGIQMPFKIKKYMNGSLILELDVTSVAVN